MRPNKRFLQQSRDLWANVRLISQYTGYSERGTGRIKVPTPQEIASAFQQIGLTTAHLMHNPSSLTDEGAALLEYFQYRADVLNTFVEPRLMTAEQAKKKFNALRKKLCPRCKIPMNKQTGDKKAPAYFTGIINMLIEANASGYQCDYDPRQLITFTSNGKPFHVLSRRVDGAFPSVINPTAIWEIKEYYYTTTFGSRVADGIYETLLDGMELIELDEHEHVAVKHYLMIDAHYTWWDCGRPYLCRIIDMLHMGFVDEVLFGTEVFERLPDIVNQWVHELKQRLSKT
jgi:hypothetical protein